MSKVNELSAIIHRVVRNPPAFFQSMGAGSGNNASNIFVKELHIEASQVFGKEAVERPVGLTGMKVDYYFAEERTIVELARLVKNPSSEFYKDILKALLARDYFAVDKLVFFGGPDSEIKCKTPSRKAIIDWVYKTHGLHVEVYDILPSAELIPSDNLEES